MPGLLDIDPSESSGIPYVPIESRVGGLAFVLCDPSGRPLGELIDLRARSVTRGLKRPRTARFSIGAGNAHRAALRDLGRTILKVYDQAAEGDVTLIHTGQLTSYERVDGDDLTVTVGSTDPSWRLAHRLLGCLDPQPITAQRAQLFDWLIRILNGDEFGDEGFVRDQMTAQGIDPDRTFATLLSGQQITYPSDTNLRTVAPGTSPTGTFQPWGFVLASDVFAEIASGLEGPDWIVLPQEPLPDAVGLRLGQFYSAAVIGEPRPGLAFEFSCGKSNVAGYREVQDPLTMANVAWHLAPGFPANRDYILREDADSITAYGRLDAVVGGDMRDPTLREQLLDDHLAVRRQPRQVVSLQLARDVENAVNVPLEDRSIPRPGIDFDVGDIGMFRAAELVPVLDSAGDIVRYDHEIVIEGLVRVHELTIDDDEEGGRQTSVTLVAS